MFLEYDQFVENARRVTALIAEICARCGRDPATVKLMAVTKAHPAQAADYAARFGLTVVGENRVQEAVAKKPGCALPIRWELIGHLQSNKAKLAVTCFDRIQSVDRLKLVGALERQCAALGKEMPVLMQVNAGEDPKKFGVHCDEADQLLEAVLAAPHLKIEGLMTMAPLDDDSAVAARAFERLRLLSERLSKQFAVALPELSMGMTSDMEAAIEAGSTMVRVGTALFGERR